jgi:predicted  nucleic acid-binding Zn-ribbon protein
MNSVETRIGDVLVFLQELESSNDSHFIVAEGSPLFNKVRQLEKLSEKVNDFQKSSITKKAAKVIFWSERLEQIMDEMLGVTSGILLEVITMFQTENHSGMQEVGQRLRDAEADLRETRKEQKDLTAFFTSELKTMQDELGACQDEFDRKLQDEVGALREEFDGKLGALREEFDGKLGALREEFDGKLGALQKEVGALKDQKNDCTTSFWCIPHLPQDE